MYKILHINQLKPELIQIYLELEKWDIIKFQNPYKIIFLKDL